MKNKYNFYKTLKPGDVITTSGVKGVSKKEAEDLTHNRLHHEGWNKFARVVKLDEKDASHRAGQQAIAVMLEGIDKTMADCFFHSANASDNTPVKIRMATKVEHRAFIEEYVKTRMEIIEHRKSELVMERKTLAREERILKSIATDEHVDVNKLMEKK